jgi:hypothetical protein
MLSRKALAASSLLFAALVFAALAPAAQAQTPLPDGPGRIVGGSIPVDGGFGLVVFTGGTYDQLVAASGCPAPRVVFWVTQGGSFLVYVPTTNVGAVNAPFEGAFPNRTIPPYTPFIGRCTLVTGSGIEGVVTLGPVCAVQSDLLPCPDRPYQGATIVFYNALEACPALTCGEVARTSTDSNGRYRVPLQPGTFTVAPQPSGSGIFPRPPGPVTVSVTAGSYATVNFAYDTGIRSVQ